MDCTLMYSVLAVLGSPGCPGDPGGKSFPVDLSGQGGLGDQSGWVVQVVQPSVGSGDPSSAGGQNDQPG